MYQPYGKRLFDLIAAILLIALLSPLFVLVALLVRIKLGTPILFRQERPGLHGRPFRMFKFRTMTEARDAHGNLLPDGDRLPPFGQLLRSTSLDELPELFNILRGEMSLVGPRPLLMEYLQRYTREQMRRHAVPPGLTGWAQVKGGRDISPADKAVLDIWYVWNASFALDALIVRDTMTTVVLGEREHKDKIESAWLDLEISGICPLANRDHFSLMGK